VLLAVQLPAALLDTEIDDTMIEVGESTMIRVRLPGDPSDVKPLKYPSVPGLKIEYSGMQRSLQIINGKSWSGAELLFTVTALKQGKYRIPGFVFSRGKDMFQSRGITLSASAGRPGSRSAVMDIKPLVTLSAARSYVGQPVVMRYYILTSGINATLRGFEHIPDTKGFVIKKIDESDNDEPHMGELEYEKNHITSFALIPTEPGIHRVGGGKAVFSVDARIRRSREEDFFQFNFPAFSQTKTIDFETRPINTLPLPRQGMPDNFRGDIGLFTIKADYTDEMINVYGEKKVTVTVEGKGNLITMTRPALENMVDGLKVISEDGESSIKIAGSEITGSRKFLYTLIPEKSGTYECGNFKLSVFNPARGSYETLSTKNISFIAKGDAKKTGPGFDTEPEKKLDFNPLYFLFIVLALGGIIGFVIFWERKRYKIATGDGGSVVEEQIKQGGAEMRDFQSDLARCVERGDGEYFLKTADKTLDLLLRGFEGAVPGEVEVAVNKIKGEIYRYKFGGGKIEHQDLKRIYEEITALIA
jgi:hypothetical protein